MFFTDAKASKILQWNPDFSHHQRERKFHGMKNWQFEIADVKLHRSTEGREGKDFWFELSGAVNFGIYILD